MKSPMKKIFLFTLLFAVFAVMPADVYSQKNSKDKIVMPEYPGGLSALHKFIASEVRFPAEARRNNEIGEVIVAFTVGVDGSISGVRVLKSVSESLDKEAVRVIKQMKYWYPGKRNGKPVRADMSIPINFKLFRKSGKYVDDEEDDSQVTENIIEEMLH